MKKRKPRFRMVDYEYEQSAMRRLRDWLAIDYDARSLGTVAAETEPEAHDVAYERYGWRFAYVERAR